MKRMLFSSVLIIGGLFFALKPHTVFAVTVTISNTPSTVNQTQEFGVDVSLSCSGCSDSYLRGVFYPSGTSYFGYTQDKNGTWVNSPASSCTSFYKVAQSDLQVSTWSGTLKIKIDTESSYYNGPGEYLFKVGRYTSSCGSPTWSSEATIAVTGPTPTPTTAPTATSAPTNTVAPTKAPTSTPTLVPTATPVPSKLPSPTVQDTPSKLVLAATESLPPTQPTKKGAVLVGAASENIIPKIMMGLGIVFMAGFAIISYPQLRFWEKHNE